MARIAGINIPRNKVVSIALTYIHGIGLHSSKRICKKLNIADSQRISKEILSIKSNKIVEELGPAIKSTPLLSLSNSTLVLDFIIFF